MNIYHEQDKNIWKTWGLMTLFFVIIIALGYVFSQAYNNSTILYIAIAFSLFMNFFSYWFSDKIVLRMYGAQEISESESPAYYKTVKELTEAAGLPMPRMYVIPNQAMNAFATGRNATRTVCIATS